MQQRIEVRTEFEESVLLNAKELIVPFFVARQRKITKTYNCRVTRVDIFNSENGFRLSNVPCRIMYKIPYATPNEGFHVRMSRCGLQFGDLTRSQLEQLKLLIENYTTEILDA